MCRSQAIPTATNPISARPTTSTCSMCSIGWATRVTLASNTSPRPRPVPVSAGPRSTASRRDRQDRDMTDKNTPAVAFIGLGSMGLGMAKNLLKHGHKVVGVDPSPAARDAFAAVGGSVAASCADATAKADVVVVAVVNAQQVDMVLYGDNGAVSKLCKGGLVMQCATVPPALAKSLGERLAKSGNELLDAPMSGGRARE